MMHWYVEIPLYGGGETHSRYWRVVCAEEGTERDEMYRTEWTKNGSGEWVRTANRYVPVADEAAGQRYIAVYRRRWERSGRND